MIRNIMIGDPTSKCLKNGTIEVEHTTTCFMGVPKETEVMCRHVNTERPTEPDLPIGIESH